MDYNLVLVGTEFRIWRMIQMAKKPSKHSIAIELPIEWTTANAPSVFANQMMVQTDEHECHISFFEIQPPLLFGSDDQKRAQVEKLKSIQARCVVRVVITRDRLKDFVGALANALAKSESEFSGPVNGSSSDTKQKK